MEAETGSYANLTSVCPNNQWTFSCHSHTEVYTFLIEITLKAIKWNRY